MSRLVGIGNVLQGLLYAVAAWILASGWMPVGVILGVVSLLQVMGGAWLLRSRDAVPAWRASLTSLVVCGFVAGLYLQAGLHVARHFTPVGQEQGWQLLGVVVLAAPWLLAFPLWQVLSFRPPRRREIAAILVALALPPAALALRQGASTLPAVPGERVATWLWDAATGAAPEAVPSGEGPVRLRVTRVRGGVPEAVAVLEGPDLAAALAPFSLRAGPGDALVLEAVRREGRLVGPWLSEPLAIVRPGTSGLLGPGGGVGALAAWRSDAVVSAELVPGVILPALAPARLGLEDPARWVVYDQWLVDDGGVVPLRQGWAAPPALTADSVRDAAWAGARHLAANQGEDGRFAYVVQGPEGIHGRGYNFPRHAGATWYLARVASRTSDPVVVQATRRAIAFLVRHVSEDGTGRAWVLDPARRDGRVWVGTTALALLALIEAEAAPDLQRAFSAFVASAVDARGEIRGDMEIETGTWPVQDAVTYAEGQGLLALAVAARAGLPVRAELDRAAAWIDGGYFPRPAARFFVLDEHWTCLAAVAVADVRGEPAGLDLCESTLRLRPHPRPGAPLGPPTGPAGALAEAVVARAELDRRQGVRGRWHELALRYGALFLAHQYSAADSPLLIRPERLVGGFRDRPWDLDVRVDAVQHIGCALLGIEQLVRGVPVDGAMP